MKEFYCLQPCKRNKHSAIFDTKKKKVEAKGNVTFFFGVNKTSIGMTGICANISGVVGYCDGTG